MEFYPPGNEHIQGSHQTGSSENQLQSDLKSRYVKSSEEGISRLSLEPSSIHFGSPIFVGWTPEKIDACKSVKKFNPPLGPSTFRRFLVSKTSPCTPKNPQVTNKIPPPKKKLSLQLSWCAFSQLIFSYPRFCFVTLTQEEQGWKLGCTQGFPGEGGCIITWVHRFTCIRACVCLLCSRCKIFRAFVWCNGSENSTSHKSCCKMMRDDARCCDTL